MPEHTELNQIAPSTKQATSTDMPLTQMREKLIEQILQDHYKTISRIDDVQWKIRTGYVVVLYGSLGLLLGTQSAPDWAAIINDLSRLLPLLLLIWGFSLSALYVDMTFSWRRLRAVVIRDSLSTFAAGLTSETEARFSQLLRTPEELSIDELSSEEANRVRNRFRIDLKHITLPIYLITPVMSLVVLLFVLIF